ncbi:MAG: ISNCY family transposase [Solobacterium sp.]|nr:ISNCY family transposase [Solobacterium sp.]
MKEQEKYECIKELVDHGGNKTRAALKLGISRRQVNRLIKLYREKGKAGFVHGNRNRQPVNSSPKELTETIVELYLTKYQGFNFLHFTQMLREQEGITVSYATVYKILTSHGIYSGLEHKITRKKRKKQEILSKAADTPQEDIETAVSHELDIEDAHPRKARAKYFGEELQTDASIHPWFAGTKTALHLSIDNATGRVLGGCFDRQETLFGYYQIFKQILTNYGIPAKFLTDRRTVFQYESKKMRSDDDDVLTQFGYACKTFGVQIETSSVSQYKGQIERANGTFQRRLVNELRLHGITTIEEANKYLIDVFIPDFNRRFSLPVEQFESVMEKSPSQETINLTLAVLSVRTFDSGSAVSYKGTYYQAYDRNDKLHCFKSKTKGLVIRALDGTLYISVDDRIYTLREFEKNKAVSKEFDPVQAPPQPKKKYIPPMSHPWKQKNFEKYQKRAHDSHLYT